MTRATHVTVLLKGWTVHAHRQDYPYFVSSENDGKVSYSRPREDGVLSGRENG